MSNIHYFEQGGPEWHVYRTGKITASRIADIMASAKTGVSASRSNYQAELMVERLTGDREESYTNAAMQWGIDTEPQARAAFEFITGNTVDLVGFVDHPTIGNAGCSPDGLVGDESIIEIKCPKSSTHMQTLLGKAIDGKYIKQIQFQLACTEREMCHFVSFDPRFPYELQLKVIDVYREEALIEEIEREVAEFDREIESKIQYLSKNIQINF